MRQFGPSDAELEAMGREVHRMWHAGVSRDEALARLRSRMAQGQYESLPRLLRPIFDRATRKVLGYMWGAKHCGPNHDVVICDEPADV